MKEHDIIHFRSQAESPFFLDGFKILVYLCPHDVTIRFEGLIEQLKFGKLVLIVDQLSLKFVHLQKYAIDLQDVVIDLNRGPLLFVYADKVRNQIPLELNLLEELLNLGLSFRVRLLALRHIQDKLIENLREPEELNLST